jgi:hypothetical protein
MSALSQPMSATRADALRQAHAYHGDFVDLVDARTLSILDRRRWTATVRRRGWLITGECCWVRTWPASPQNSSLPKWRSLATPVRITCQDRSNS